MLRGLAPSALRMPNSCVRSQRLAYAEFVRALPHGDEHDVAHAHNAAQQREDAYYPNGSTQYGHGVLCLQVTGEAVPQPDGAVVLRVEAVVGSYHPAVVAFKGLVALFIGQALRGEDNAVQLVSFIIYSLQGGEGHVSLAGLHVALVGKGAHHLVGHAAHVDKLAQRVRVRLAEQYVGRSPCGAPAGRSG